MTGTALLSRGFESLRSRRSLRTAREAADREIRRSPAPSLRVAWRAAELVVPSKRFELARSLRWIARDADARHLPGASPINRGAVRAVTEPMLELADRLEDLERPAGARGVLLLDGLLLDGDGPLYEQGPADLLLARLDEASAALEAS
jgi:hypothetical protein